MTAGVEKTLPVDRNRKFRQAVGLGAFRPEQADILWPGHRARDRGGSVVSGEYEGQNASLIQPTDRPGEVSSVPRARQSPSKSSPAMTTKSTPIWDQCWNTRNQLSALRHGWRRAYRTVTASGCTIALGRWRVLKLRNSPISSTTFHGESG